MRPTLLLAAVLVAIPLTAIAQEQTPCAGTDHPRGTSSPSGKPGWARAAVPLAR